MSSPSALRRSLLGLAVPTLSVLVVGTGCATAPPPGARAVPVDVTAAPVSTPAHAGPGSGSGAGPGSGSGSGSGSGLQATLLAEARTFVFRARNESCLTVGTAFATAGRILTNRHVAAGASTLDLATWDGQDFSSRVAGHSVQEDLALLDAFSPEDHFATLAAADPNVGTAVYVAGYPLGDQLTVTAGRVLGTVPGDPLGVTGPVLELSDAVQHGNSGSPLLDAAGQVVGVVFAMDTATHDGLAMPVSALRPMVEGAAPDSSRLACVDLSP